MRDQLSVQRTAVLLGTILIVVAVGYVLGRDNQSPARVYTGDDPATPTATPVYPDPIYDEQDAIARSLELFPSGHNPHNEVARLISGQTLESWMGVYQNVWGSDIPVWLVGILGDNLVIGDIIDYTEYGATPSVLASELAVGAFYAWDANNGSVIGEGPLGDSSWSETYDSLSALPDEPLAIAPATEEPTIVPPEISDLTPEPTDVINDSEP